LKLRSSGASSSVPTTSRTWHATSTSPTPKRTAWTPLESRCQFHQRSTHSFYARRSQKRKKIQLSHQYLLTLSGSASIKDRCRTLMKLSPGQETFYCCRFKFILKESAFQRVKHFKPTFWGQFWGSWVIINEFEPYKTIPHTYVNKSHFLVYSIQSSYICKILFVFVKSCIQLLTSIGV